MLKLAPAVSNGKAVFISDELRCQAPRAETRGDGVCNKLIAKFNRLHQIAGQFRCERCKQEIEVRMVPAGLPASPLHPAAVARPAPVRTAVSQSPRLEEAQIKSKEASS
jgi:hypothetical protein